jgi:hypothetical protein
MGPYFKVILLFDIALLYDPESKLKLNNKIIILIVSKIKVYVIKL